MAIIDREYIRFSGCEQCAGVVVVKLAGKVQSGIYPNGELMRLSSALLYERECWECGDAGERIDPAFMQKPQ